MDKTYTSSFVGGKWSDNNFADKNIQKYMSLIFGPPL